jgi:hypothetical protein
VEAVASVVLGNGCVVGLFRSKDIGVRRLHQSTIKAQSTRSNWQALTMAISSTRLGFGSDLESESRLLERRTGWPFDPRGYTAVEGKRPRYHRAYEQRLAVETLVVQEVDSRMSIVLQLLVAALKCWGNLFAFEILDWLPQWVFGYAVVC